MSKPLVVSIPHKLGKDEAVRRLKAGLGHVRTSFGGIFTLTEEHWSGEHLEFRAGALGQTTSGTVDVADDHVRVEVQLPWLLAQLAQKAKALIQKQGHLMLEKK
jgi:Putative polyhydroxyalkanoic acid system protein (PHA_gran_rgn)